MTKFLQLAWKLAGWEKWELFPRSCNRGSSCDSGVEWYLSPWFHLLAAVRLFAEQEIIPCVVSEPLALASGDTRYFCLQKQVSHGLSCNGWWISPQIKPVLWQCLHSEILPHTSSWLFEHAAKIMHTYLKIYVLTWVLSLGKTPWVSQSELKPNVSGFHVYSFHKHSPYAVCSCCPERFSSPGVWGICALRAYSIDSAVGRRSDAGPLHKSFLKLEEFQARQDEVRAKTVSTQSISVNKSNRSQSLSPSA